MRALLGVMALGAWLAAGPALAETGDLCAQPVEVQGFKTCADVAKAEAEGEIVVYATNPEAAELKVLAQFNALFPKIKTNYTRLQAGALYAKVSAERQAKTYTVDVMQISDMGMIRFRKERLCPLRLASDGQYKADYKASPKDIGRGAHRPRGPAFNTTTVTPDQQDLPTR